MANPANDPPRLTTRLDGYVYRRPLSGRELLPAIGAGVATGLLAFYVAMALVINETAGRPVIPVP